MKKVELKILPVGTKVFAINNNYYTKQMHNVVIVPCKIRTYEVRNGKVLPICRIINGNGKEITKDNYQLFTSAADALNSLQISDCMFVEKL